MAAEAIAFQSAMGHFFPKSHPHNSNVNAAAASSMGLSSPSTSFSVDVSTPTELDQFIVMGQLTPSSQQSHFGQHQQEQQMQQQFSIDALSAF